MVCPKCGRRTFKREAICPKCGAAMPERISVEAKEANQASETNDTEGESDLNFFNRNKPKAADSAQPQQPMRTPEPGAGETAAESVNRAEPEIYQPPIDTAPPVISEPPAQSSVVDAQSEPSVYVPPEFYGSYGEVCNDAAQASPVTNTQQSDPSLPDTGSTDGFSMTDFDITGVTVSSAADSSATEESEFSPILNFPGGEEKDDDDDELVLPDIPVSAPDPAGEKKKSMGYEVTVKLQNARSAYGNQKPVNEPIKSGGAVSAPKRRDYTVVASGTAHVSGDLPKLKDGEMYVAITPKELRLLNSRRFRGLGILATLCLVIISAFCIWSYANSFTDPLVGAWKGDMSAVYLPIEQLQQLDQEIVQSTWEFSSNGSMYLSIVINETPISLSGTYEQKKDVSGEPYITMTITNPMDSSNYSLDMYYTVTGTILELNDTQGMGITIDLTKE